MVPEARPGITIPSGVPIRVALERRVAIKGTGEPIEGRLVDPVYVFDRVALPAGSVVEGHIASIGGVPARRRLISILSGNLTPPREVRAQFDGVVLGDGSRLSMRTLPSRGTAPTARVQGRKRQGAKAATEGSQDGVRERNRAAVLAFKTPGKVSRAKTALLGMLPYHRQAWPAGTLFTGVLQDPLKAPASIPDEARTDSPAAGTEAQEVRARLLSPISSATAVRGAPVEAVVTQPQYSGDRRLLIPEGSRLLGEVVKAQKARRLHRNGKLLFVFHQVQLPSAAAQNIQGYLEGAEADFDAHLTLDSEGATHARSPASRFVFPAIAIAAAGLSFHQDYNSQGVPDQDIGGRAESGAVGLGLIGTLVAQLSRTVASSIAIAGAAFSVYSNFIARGEDVILPANTPVTVSLRARGAGSSSAGRRTH